MAEYREDIEQMEYDNSADDVPQTDIDTTFTPTDTTDKANEAAEAYTAMAFTRSGMNDLDRALEQRAVNRQSLIDLFRNNEEVLEKRKRTDRSVAIGQAIGELLGAFAGTAISPKGRSIVPESQSPKSYAKYLAAIEQGNADRTKLQSLLNKYDSDTVNLYHKKADAEAKYNLAVARYNAAIENGRRISEDKAKDRRWKSDENEKRNAATIKAAAIKASSKDDDSEYKFTKDEYAKANRFAEITGNRNRTVTTKDALGNEITTTNEKTDLTKGQVAEFSKAYDRIKSIKGKDGKPISDDVIRSAVDTIREIIDKADPATSERYKRLLYDYEYLADYIEDSINAK